MASRITMGTVLAVGALLLVASGCGSDDDSGGTGGTASGGTPGSGGAATGGMPGSGGAATGGTATGGAQSTGGSGGMLTGCVPPDAVACPTGLVCCSGVPYPEGGICLTQCTMVSDRALKEGFSAIDPESVLDRVQSLPISEWSYRDEAGSVRHIGPMAQDFRAAFGVGADERHIHPVDASGVALAAIQALARRVDALERENQALRDRVERVAAGR